MFLPLSVNHVAVHLSQILSEIHVENNKPKVLFEISFPEATYSFSFTSSSRFYLTQLCLPVPWACLTLVGLLVFFFFFSWVILSKQKDLVVPRSLTTLCLKYFYLFLGFNMCNVIPLFSLFSNFLKNFLIF